MRLFFVKLWTKLGLWWVLVLPRRILNRVLNTRWIFLSFRPSFSQSRRRRSSCRWSCVLCMTRKRIRVLDWKAMIWKCTGRLRIGILRYRTMMGCWIIRGRIVCVYMLLRLGRIDSRPNKLSSAYTQNQESLSNSAAPSNLTISQLDNYQKNTPKSMIKSASTTTVE